MSDDYGTPKDIMEAYADLDEAELRTLRSMAGRYRAGTRFTEPLDLIHEALALSASGSRRWPRHLHFGIYMVMTMRSIANADRRRHENRFASRAQLETALEWIYSDDTTHPSAEDEAIAAEDAANRRKAREDSRDAFDPKDQFARQVLDGLLSGMTSEEMIEKLQLDVSIFYAARKRVLRKLRNIAKLK